MIAVFSKSYFFLFLIPILFSSCGENGKEIKNESMAGPKKDTVTTFNWAISYSGPDSNLAEVSLVVKNSLRTDTLAITVLSSPVKLDGYPVEPDSLIIGENILTASGWWAGGGDALFLMKEKGEYFVYWQQIDEESGWLPSEKIGEIILSSSPETKATFNKFKSR